MANPKNVILAWKPPMESARQGKMKYKKKNVILKAKKIPHEALQRILRRQGKLAGDFLTIQNISTSGSFENLSNYAQLSK